MNTKNKEEAIITINADWEEECYRYYVSLFLSLSDEETGSAEEVEDGTNMRESLAYIKNMAYACGCRRVLIRSEEGEQHLRLISSAKREALCRQRAGEICGRRRAIRNRKVRERRYKKLALTLSTKPDAQSIRRFFKNWKRVTGYGLRDDNLRGLLAPAKAGLVKSVVSRAHQEGWNAGIATDLRVYNGFNRVVYIDTPLGQVSFHTSPDEYSDLPVYNAQWSGDKGGTARILSQLYQ
jgi:hypothetical protein